MGKRVASANGNSAAAIQAYHETPPLVRSIRKRNRRPAASAALKSFRYLTAGGAAHNNSHNNHNGNNGNAHDDSDEMDADEQDSNNSASNEASNVAAAAIAEQHHHHHNNNNSNAIKQANNSSLLFNTPLQNARDSMATNGTAASTESPKPVYTLRPSIVNGTVLHDLTQKPWRLGRPIGKGNFGEIFLASDNINVPVTNENAKFVVKIEPHLNGPLFVEIHCLMNTAKKKPDSHQDDDEDDDDEEDEDDDESNTDDDDEEDDTDAERTFKGKPGGGGGGARAQKTNADIDNRNVPQIAPSGIPDYIASGSHYFNDVRYRFLVLPRFDRDLHSLVKNCRVHEKSILTLAIQIVNVLENLHDKGYCHNDVKAQNLMISKCNYFKRKLTTTTTTTPTPASRGAHGVSKNGQRGVGGGRTKRKLLPTLTKRYNEERQQHHHQHQHRQQQRNHKNDRYDEKQPTTDSGNSSEQEVNFENPNDKDFVVKRFRFKGKQEDEDDDEEDEDDEDEDDQDEDDDEEENGHAEEEDEGEDFDEDTNSASNNSNSMDTYRTPLNSKNQALSRKNLIQFSGSNPIRSCRRQQPNAMYDEMVMSHYLRPTKRVSYSEFFGEDGLSVKGDDASEGGLPSSGDESEEFLPRLQSTEGKKSAAGKTKRPVKRITRRQEQHIQVRKGRGTTTNTNATTTTTTTTTVVPELVAVVEERVFLIDFGLASKFCDRGIHRPFVMDQRRAHDGTLEFTSRDAHMGAHSRRSDLECLGYNLLFWSQGYLPWKEAAAQHQQEKVHRAKEYLMTDVREMLKQVYGKAVPKYLGEFLHHVGQLAYHERPDYARYRRIFEREFQQLGYAASELRLDSNEIARTCVRYKEDAMSAARNDIFDTSKPHHQVWSVMSNVSIGTPFQERSLSSRVSPKNLRSKSDKKMLKKKKFSWAEILSQDPDQIARERAEKEFDREECLSEVQQPTVRRYEGKPTYAILKLRQRLQGQKVGGGSTECNKAGAQVAVGAKSLIKEDKNEDGDDVSMDGRRTPQEPKNEADSNDEDGKDNFEANSDEENNMDCEDDEECDNVPRANNGHGQRHVKMAENEEEEEALQSETSNHDQGRQHNGRGRPAKRERKRNATKTPTKATTLNGSSRKANNNVATAGGGRSTKSKYTAAVEFTTKTRRSAKTVASKPSKAANSGSRQKQRRRRRSRTPTQNGHNESSRSSMSQGEQQQQPGAASAAGEVEQSNHRCHNNVAPQTGGEQQSQRQRRRRQHNGSSSSSSKSRKANRNENAKNASIGSGNGSGNGSGKRKHSRRKASAVAGPRSRRCLIKADAAAGDEGGDMQPLPQHNDSCNGGGGEAAAPRGPFNMWKNVNQQHAGGHELATANGGGVYFRGNGHATAVRHNGKKC